MVLNEKNEKEERLGLEILNNQNCLMKIVEYNKASDIVVEFQDEYNTKIHTDYRHFLNGSVRNPYYKSLYGVGRVGNKYPASINGKDTKEYKVWNHMIERCFSKKYHDKQHTYKDVTCCKKWELYDNFYIWIHNQSNFNQWFDGKRWGLDKDILIKGNKVYSPNTCCLVPQNVNNLFTKNNIIRGNTIIGVHEQNGKYLSLCNNPFTNSQEYLGSYNTQEEAFLVYKKYKEQIIKQVAEIEYEKGNITKQCYEAMMKYEVEITD